MGDQVPPAYPIVDVHVPEPMVGSLERELVMEESQQSSKQMEEIDHSLAASDQMFKTAMALVTAKIEHVGVLAEAAMKLPGGVELKQERK